MTWFSLGGCAPLSGENVSHFVYVDEAGVSNPKQEPFLVVAGVIINADKKLAGVRAALDMTVERHIPRRYHSEFVFHATELFNGTTGKDGPFDRLDGLKFDERLRCASDLAAIPKRFGLKLALGFVDRADFAKKNPIVAGSEDPTAIAQVVAFMSCAMQVEQWARQETPHEVCLMIVEDNDRARSLIRHTQNLHQSPRVMAGLGAGAAKHFPFRKITEDPLFQSKKPSSALQMADFCAYVYKKILMGDERYERFMAPLWDCLVVDYLAKTR